jgi:hypothetical protein
MGLWLETRPRAARGFVYGILGPAARCWYRCKADRVESARTMDRARCNRLFSGAFFEKEALHWKININPLARATQKHAGIR